jgi:hypothetical protein
MAIASGEPVPPAALDLLRQAEGIISAQVISRSE